MNPDSRSIAVLPVIMAGGSGTRLWPLSRARHPKQFLVLHGDRSLFQQAARRLADIACDDIAVEAPCIVGNEEHRFLVLEQLREVKLAASTVLLEPVGRNTAPAVTLAALEATRSGADPVLVVSPSDQTVTDPAAFTASLRDAVRRAAAGAIVILGVVPTRPETGYGYIRVAGPAGADGTAPVARFVEKPDLSTAEAYVSDGGYRWNSGMFVMRASVWLAAVERFRPDVARATQAAFESRAVDSVFVRPGREAFAAIPSESVDYAVMEPLAALEDRPIELRMASLAAGWNDLGAWEAVWQVSEKDHAGNATRGDTLLHDSRNTLVHATSRLVGVVGLEGVVVVETPDAVLVAGRESSQDVKRIVADLQRDDRSEHSLHRQVHRPWGWYDSICAAPRFQVKRIMVKPGASLSLQMHHHRAEHWIVVSGTAEVTCGEKKTLLTENQSTYIPLGEVHRLANPGTIPLEIIEVQSGSYLGEDDIVRFEDTYGRTQEK